MKRAYFVRHAKSSWEHDGLSDAERPLNKRGLNDAPLMAALCASKHYIPDIIITSHAKRALSTAEFFKKAFDLSDDRFLVDTSLYHAPPEAYYEVMYGLDDHVNSVMMFGHNPGLTYLANEFDDDFIDNVPTTGVVVVNYQTSKWTKCHWSIGTRMDFLSPKKSLKK